MPSIREVFTFRSGSRAATVSALIDTGADSTQITLAIAAALELSLARQTTLILADGSRSIALLCKCTVAWTPYEDHGYSSTLDVVCAGDEAIVGMDFLRQHELSVDMHNKGLVGHAPEKAEPLTGGGYMVNPPKGLVAEVNYHRVAAAPEGKILRPHPAWRFTHPAIQKGARPDQAT